MWRRTLIHTYLAHQLTEWKIVNTSWSHACKGISEVEESTAANVQDNQRSQSRTLQIVLAQNKGTLRQKLEVVLLGTKSVALSEPPSFLFFFFLL